MSISKDVIKQCLISKQREVDEAVIVNRPTDFEENGNYVIVGVRHAGKSYLLYQRVRQLQAAGKGWDEILFVDFEDERLAEFQTEDFNSLLEAHLELYGKKPVVFLDEVQNIPHWDKFVRRLADAKHRVYVTGSNAKFLSKDIITEFRGRGYQIHVSPLSFAEFMSVYEGDREDGWNEYLLYGGLPPVVLLKTEEEKVKLLDSLLAETYIIDVVNRNKIKNDSELNDLFKILASGIGGLTNPQRLSNTFQSVKNVSISPATIKKYIECLSDAFLLESCNRYDVKGRKYIGTPLKYYFSDLGIRNALLGFRQQEKTHLMENAVYNELCARGYSVDVGNVEVNTVDEKGTKVRRMLEVDFVCNRGYKRCYIQSALSLPDREKMQQESASLLRINDSFMKYVITGDRIKKYQNDDGIVIMNVLDFLLDEQSV